MTTSPTPTAPASPAAALVQHLIEKGLEDLNVFPGGQITWSQDNPQGGGLILQVTADAWNGRIATVAIDIRTLSEDDTDRSDN